jgi:hypothetical protein
MYGKLKSRIWKKSLFYNKLWRIKKYSGGSNVRPPEGAIRLHFFVINKENLII